jgi:hypothetical protein
MSSTTYVSSVELHETSLQNPPQLPQSYAQPVPFHSNQNEAPRNARGVQQYLEPVDGGAAAWRLLSAAFVFEALFWGEDFPPRPFNKSNGIMLLLTRNFKGFLFPLVFFRITTLVFRNLQTVRIFLL